MRSRLQSRYNQGLKTHNLLNYNTLKTIHFDTLVNSIESFLR